MDDSVDQIYNTDPIYRCYPWEDSVHQIYNSDSMYICYPWENLFDQTYNSNPIYICYPWENSIDQIYNTDPIYICCPWEDSVDQIYNIDTIYICYQKKIQSLKYTIPVLSTYVTTRRLSRSDIQYRPYLHMLPWEDSVAEIYNTGSIYICYDEKTQSIDIQYRLYLNMLPREDAVDQIYNTGPIYIYYHEKTQFNRYTIPTLSTYATNRRLSQSYMQYRPYLHMLPRDDAVDQI